MAEQDHAFVLRPDADSGQSPTTNETMVLAHAGNAPTHAPPLSGTGLQEGAFFPSGIATDIASGRQHKALHALLRGAAGCRMGSRAQATATPRMRPPADALCPLIVIRNQASASLNGN